MKHEVDGNEPTIPAPAKNSSHTSSNPGNTPCGNPGLLKDAKNPPASAWEQNETPSGGGKSKSGIESNTPFL